jgi:hypothetical protein
MKKYTIILILSILSIYNLYSQTSLTEYNYCLNTLPQVINNGTELKNGYYLEELEGSIKEGYKIYDFGKIKDSNTVAGIIMLYDDANLFSTIVIPSIDSDEDVMTLFDKQLTLYSEDSRWSKLVMYCIWAFIYF